MSLSRLTTWVDEACYAPEAEPVSCFSGLRRLSGRIFLSCASVVFLAYLAF